MKRAKIFFRVRGFFTPFPSEHSARLASPGNFDKFRRANNAGGAGVHFIYGIKAGKSQIQAIRFSKDKFTPAEAKAWLKSHNKTAISFTPAKASSEHSGPSVSEITVPTANRDMTIQYKYNEDEGEELVMEPDELIDCLLEHPDLSLEAVKEGMIHEMEHTDNPEIALKIAIDHLLEHVDYYKKLAEMFTESRVDCNDYASKKGAADIEMKAMTPEVPPTDMATAPASFKKNEDEEKDEDDELNGDEDFALGFHPDGSLCVEAFREGTHVDSAGVSATWTDKDLTEIESKGNAQLAEKPVPVVLGHPEDNSPAYGWVEKFKKVGGKLRVKLNQLNDAFKEALKSGAYKGRSISLYDDNRVRHVGFLGGAQPAIPGLQPLSFIEDKPFRLYDFNEEIPMIDEDVNKKLNFYEKVFKIFGLEVQKYNKEKNTMADKEKAFVEDTVKKMEDGAGKKEAPAKVDDAALAEIEKKDPGTEATVKVMTAEAKNEASKVSDENAQLKSMVESLMSRVKSLEEALATGIKNHAEAETKAKELETKNKELETKVAKTEEQSLFDFVENLIKDGKLRPVDREMTLMALQAQVELDKVPVINMSEGKAEPDPNRKARVEIYKEHLTGMPKIVEFGEFPNLPAAQTGVAFPAPDAGTMGDYIEKKVAVKLAEKDKLGLTSKTSYWDTLKECMAEAAKEQPEVYKEYVRGHLMPGMPGIR